MWNEKPVCIIGAGGYAGTTRAQGHLRDICFNLNMKNLNGGFGSGREIRIEIFQESPPPFGKSGDLESERWQGELEKTMAGLQEWAALLKKK